MLLGGNVAGTIVGRAEGDFDIFVNFVNGLPEIANPPAGVVDGINYIDDITVILLLFAPNKDFVHVIGDFNNGRSTLTTSARNYQRRPFLAAARQPHPGSGVQVQ